MREHRVASASGGRRGQRSQAVRRSTLRQARLVRWAGGIGSGAALALVATAVVAVRAGWLPAIGPPDAPAPVAEAPVVATPTVVVVAATPTPPPSPTSPPATATPAVVPLPPRSPATGPAVALTFDAGADRGYAEDILDTLREAGVPASFGVTGRWAEDNPDLVRRMAADGHMVINHTVDHRSFTGLSDELGGLSAERRRSELEAADAILAPLVGHTTKPWYRLPYGDDADSIAADVAPTGFTRKAGWTIDSLGWRGLAASDIVARCLKLAEPDAIYVFHVMHTSADGPALARIIAGLREHGLGFATLENLLS